MVLCRAAQLGSATVASLACEHSAAGPFRKLRGRAENSLSKRFFFDDFDDFDFDFWKRSSSSPAESDDSS
ncbi:hypothetical protein JCM11491_006829, partial [Sporobolomyces phaffii]